MNPFYNLVADRAAHRCEYCHAPELVFNFPFEVEHIVPICRGGEAAEYNLALACRSCNLRDILPTPHLTATAGASFLHRLGFLLHGSLSIFSFLHRLLDDLPDRCKPSFKD